MSMNEPMIRDCSIIDDENSRQECERQNELKKQKEMADKIRASGKTNAPASQASDLYDAAKNLSFGAYGWSPYTAIIGAGIEYAKRK